VEPLKKPLTTLVFLIGTLLQGVGNMAQATEEPQYQLLEQLGDIEIRHYDPVIQAITNQPAGAGNGFRRLAGFIFGGNSEKLSIAMTAPVQENLDSSAHEMAFTLPREFQLEDLPTPDDPAVIIAPVPPRTVAVLRFSGWASDKKVVAMREQMSAQLLKLGLTTHGDWLLNQYNPPWTLPFLRRNELWIEVDWPS
jgi:hypothetical protein